MEKPYLLADPCPNCGERDSHGAWKGARLGSTEWGHDWSCCSKACGLAFRDSPQRARLEVKRLDQKIAVLMHERERWAPTNANAKRVGELRALGMRPGQAARKAAREAVKRRKGGNRG